MEIKTTEEFWNEAREPSLMYIPTNEECNKKWVAVDDIKKELEEYWGVIREMRGSRTGLQYPDHKMREILRGLDSNE